MKKSVHFEVGLRLKKDRTTVLARTKPEAFDKAIFRALKKITGPPGTPVSVQVRNMKRFLQAYVA